MVCLIATYGHMIFYLKDMWNLFLLYHEIPIEYTHLFFDMLKYNIKKKPRKIIKISREKKNVVGSIFLIILSRSELHSIDQMQYVAIWFHYNVKQF